MHLPKPFDTFCIECHAGEHKDFGLSPDDEYPLKGVTYPVDYGEIDGYITEDSAKLDLFVGTDESGLRGYIIVKRPDVDGGEHKYYLNLNEDEEVAVLDVFTPVIIEHGRFDTLEEMTKDMEKFKALSDKG